MNVLIWLGAFIAGIGVGASSATVYFTRHYGDQEESEG